MDTAALFPSAVSRRAVLRAGGLGLLGLGLTDALRAAPKRKAKACIVLFMWGGPAQQDTWDPKPDAPDVYRGEFGTIPTTVPGLRVCEHLPELAKRADRLCLIRSMTHPDTTSSPAAPPPPVRSRTTGRTTAPCWPASAAELERCRLTSP